MRKEFREGEGEGGGEAEGGERREYVGEGVHGEEVVVQVVEDGEAIRVRARVAVGFEFAASATVTVAGKGGVEAEGIEGRGGGEARVRGERGERVEHLWECRGKGKRG